jgi:hypothetical protein
MDAGTEGSMSSANDRDRKTLRLANGLSQDAKELEEARRARENFEERLQGVEQRLGLPEAPCLPGAIEASAIGSVPTKAISLDELVSPDVLSRLEQRHDCDFTRKHQLDRWDVLAGCLCGVIGGAVDFLLVSLPKDVIYLGELPQKAGPLPTLLKRWNVSNDNFLARIARVPYDQPNVPGARVPGMYSKNHRLLTPGHDPLVGVVVGVVDIIRGGRTAFDIAGTPYFHPGLTEGITNPLVACAIWLLHLFSDVATPMGLPPPGWSLTQLLQVGEFGKKGRTVADLARYMYLNGYDFRHFVASASSVAAIELSLSAYFGGRRFFDSEYELDCRADAPRDRSYRHHPRYRAMRLIADAIACGANAGKIAVYAGNPLAFNYTQWLALLRSAAGFLDDLLESPTTVLLDKATANEAILEGKWDKLYEKVLRGALRLA